MQGYSKFGYFTGNGSTDGPFIYTGFKPKYVWYRNVSRNNNAVYYASTDISSLSGIDKTYETNPITTGGVFDGAKEFSVTLGAAGTKDIIHKLGKKPTGFVLADTDQFVLVRKVSSDETLIKLDFSGACSAKVVVY